MLGINRTTLFRSLAKEGVHYHQAVERVRFNTARDLLGNS